MHAAERNYCKARTECILHACTPTNRLKASTDAHTHNAPSKQVGHIIAIYIKVVTSFRKTPLKLNPPAVTVSLKTNVLVCSWYRVNGTKILLRCEVSVPQTNNSGTDA